MQEGNIELKDGRILSYTTYGPIEGKPVLYFHGTPSSSHELQLLKAYDIEPEELLKDAYVKIIAVDRPGMGRSSFNPGGNFTSFSHDVAELMQVLRVSSAPIVSWSGGGPYSLSMVYHFPDKVEAVYIICGFTRKFDKEILDAMGFNKWYFKLAKNLPGLLKTSMNILRKKKINSFLPQKFTGLSYVDYALLDDPENISAVSQVTLKHACKNGAGGAVYEAANYFSDPGYDLSAIERPVHYWWGTKDMSVIIHHPREIEERVKNSIVYYREGEGHLSLYINCFAEVMQMVGEPRAITISK